MDQAQVRARAKMMVLEQLFEHEGWPVLMDELKNEIEVIKDEMLVIENWEKVNFNKGRVMQLLDMLYLSDTIHNMAQVEIESEEEEDDYADV